MRLDVRVVHFAEGVVEDLRRQPDGLARFGAVVRGEIPDHAVVAGVPGGDDEAFARGLLAQYNVTVLPGRYLAREFNGVNPGQGRVRMALVAQPDECLQAAQRIVQFVQSLPTST